MIRRFDRDTIHFQGLGDRILSPQSAMVTEEKNGEYSLELQMLTEDCDLNNEDVIVAPTPYGNSQPFRIYKKQKSISGLNTTVSARHIFYDLLDNFVEVIRPTLKTGQEALNLMLNATNFTHLFHGYSNISKKNVAYWELKNPIEILIGDEDNSFINRWGGELYRDNWTFTINEHEQDNIPTIMYSKNLQDCGLEVNIEEVVTRLMPTGLQENGQTILKLPEKYIDSPNIGDYINPKVGRIHYSDIKISEDLYATESEAYEALRTAAQNEYNNGIDKPEVSGTLSVIELSATEEYKNIAKLEKLKPFDSIKVKLPKGESVETKMVRYTFNAITQRYDSIEFGALKKCSGQSLARSLDRGLPSSSR